MSSAGWPNPEGTDQQTTDLSARPVDDRQRHALGPDRIGWCAWWRDARERRALRMILGDSPHRFDGESRAALGPERHMENASTLQFNSQRKVPCSAMTSGCKSFLQLEHAGH